MKRQQHHRLNVLCRWIRNKWDPLGQLSVAQGLLSSAATKSGKCGAVWRETETWKCESVSTILCQERIGKFKGWILAMTVRRLNLIKLTKNHTQGLREIMRGRGEMQYLTPGESLWLWSFSKNSHSSPVKGTAHEKLLFVQATFHNGKSKVMFQIC